MTARTVNIYVYDAANVGATSCAKKTTWLLSAPIFQTRPECR